MCGDADARALDAFLLPDDMRALGDAAMRDGMRRETNEAEGQRAAEFAVTADDASRTERNVNGNRESEDEGCFFQNP
jgi:hypothetical protein